MAKKYNLRNRPDGKTAAAEPREPKEQKERVSPIGMRIAKCSMKEAADGGADGEATIIGVAIAQGRDLVAALGQDVQLKTAGNGGRTLNGTLRSIQFTAGKGDKPARVSLKVGGGRALDTMIGVGVKVQPAQKSLL